MNENLKEYIVVYLSNNIKRNNGMKFIIIWYNSIFI